MKARHGTNFEPGFDQFVTEQSDTALGWTVQLKSFPSRPCFLLEKNITKKYLQVVASHSNQPPKTTWVR